MNGGASSAPVPPPDGDKDVAELVASLQARLEASGEWERLLKTLRKGLQDSEWDSNLREYARGALCVAHQRLCAVCCAAAEN